MMKMTDVTAAGTAPAMEFTFRWWGPDDPVQLSDWRQVPNIRTVVTSLGHLPIGAVWSAEEIATRQEQCRRAGFEWTTVESVPVHEAIKLADAERDRFIDSYRQTVRNLGAAGIRVVCYNFMPVIDWMRTDFDYRLADGSVVTSYSQAEFDAIDLAGGLPKLPAWPQGYTYGEFQALTGEYAGVTDADYLERYRYFVEAVAPVAEEAGVKLGIHPDDPPWPIFGLPRIAGTESQLQALLDCSPSPAHGLTFCSGSLGVLAENDLPAMVRRFSDRIHFVHLRNLSRRGEREFHEVDHTRAAGDVDLVEIMRALTATGYTGPVRPDHGRMIWGETGIAGYGLHDRALGVMYLQGIHDAFRR